MRELGLEPRTFCTQTGSHLHLYWNSFLADVLCKSFILIIKKILIYQYVIPSETCLLVYDVISFLQSRLVSQRWIYCCSAGVLSSRPHLLSNSSQRWACVIWIPVSRVYHSFQCKGKTILTSVILKKNVCLKICRLMLIYFFKIFFRFAQLGRSPYFHLL